MFSHLAASPDDPILALNEAFMRDARTHKVNLSIGMYFDETGALPVLDAVREAERRVAVRGGAKPYLPIEGQPDFSQAVRALLFGHGHEAVASGRIATLQTVGSCGALRVGAELLRQAFPGSGVWVSDPTWENHRAVFKSAGLAVCAYPYFDHGTGRLRFDAMCEAVGTLPAHSVVLLHACGHNPTGVDMTAVEWKQLAALMAKRALIPFVDLAYQGFCEGLDADAAPVRLLADAGLGLLVANSFSKNMGVYGERCGALSVVCPDAVQATLVLGQLKAIVRQNYSSPPMHAGRLVTEVLNDAALREAWAREVEGMRLRTNAMRAALHEVLRQRLPGYDADYLLRQRGMFSFTGLSPAQVDALRESHAVYLVRSGRMCLSGLNGGNVDRVADAIARVIG